MAPLPRPAQSRPGHLNSADRKEARDVTNRDCRQGSKALTRPSRDAMKKIRRRLADELRDMRGAPTAEVICKLNPVIRGQANYYRSGASKKSFQALDSYLWRQLYKWARRRHPKKGRRWVTARYFGQYCQHRRNRWVFGDRETGAYLHKYAWTKIVRHAPVPGRHSPYDPALAQFWADRRRKQKPPQLAPAWQKALRDQQGLCPLCRELLLFADRAPDSPGQWETWYAAVGKAMTRQAITDTSTAPAPAPAPAGRNTASCTPTAPAATQTANATARNSRPHAPDRPRGLLEPCAATSGKHGSEEGSAGKRRSLSDYYLLEAAGLTVQLVSPAHARQLAGRPKTDRLDAQQLARLAEMGLLRPSFVPPPEIRALRDLTRTRAAAGPRPDEGVAAAGEAAGGRAGQAVVRGALHVQDQDGP